MTRELHSILLEDIEIAWPGFTLRRVALNQHMPRVEKLSEHHHGFHQVLLYLRGHGTQHIRDRTVAVRRGSVMTIPPDTTHRFEKEGRLRPVCLAINFDASTTRNWHEESLMSAPQLARVEEWLVDLHREEARPEKSLIRISSLILQLLALIEECASGELAKPESGPVSASVRRAIDQHGLAGTTPGLLARQLRRSLDHLNRQLRFEVGTTLGGMINRARLETSQELLQSTSLEIGEIASTVGIDDQNYFARWFRKATGQSPSHWREARREDSAR